MKTKEHIKKEGLQLFNEFGVKNITLRHIAEKMGKSYGNVTYHFKTKKDLIRCLYDDYLKDMDAMILEISSNQEHLFKKVLNPKLSFALSLRYLFFYKDLVEVKRSYPEIFLEIEKNNELRKQSYLELLNILKQINFLREDLGDDELMYLMELSGIVRTFFFIQSDYSELLKPNAIKKFSRNLNQLLVPYLTEKGKKIYHSQSL